MQTGKVEDSWSVHTFPFFERQELARDYGSFIEALCNWQIAPPSEADKYVQCHSRPAMRLKKLSFEMTREG